MASDGPLDVPGRSKNARMSAARRLIVRPRVISSGRSLGDACGEFRDHAFEDLPPAGGILVSVGGDRALVDVPGDLDGDMIGMLVEHCLERRELVPLQQSEPRPEQTAAP